MRGAPDDSNVLSTSTFYRLDDMAELAVRLGSPVQYLRSGNIVFCTTFEDGFNRLSYHAPVLGGSVSLVNSLVLTGGAAVEIGFIAVANSGGSITAIVPPVLTGQIGVATALKLSLWEGYIEVTVNRRGVDRLRIFTVRLYPQTNTGVYLDSGGVPVEFTSDLHLDDSNDYYTLVKLVVNPDTKYYQSVIVGDTRYDLSSYLGRDLAGVAPYNLSGVVGIYGDGGAVNATLIDHLIVTKNEP